jgi:hypothetical protein
MRYEIGELRCNIDNNVDLVIDINMVNQWAVLIVLNDLI